MAIALQTNAPAATRHLPMLAATLVNDVHWSLMHIGALTIVIGAAAARQTPGVLKPWRHLVNSDDAAIMLALRYGQQLGLSQASVKSLSSLLDQFAQEKRRLAARLPTGGVKEPEGAANLASFAQAWRALANVARGALSAIRGLTATLEEPEYAADATLIDAFLLEAAKGELKRYYAAAGFELPQLQQRRSSPRVRQSRPCKIMLAGRAHEGSLIDLSREGLGLSTTAVAPIGARLEILLAGGRKLEGVVVRASRGQLGVRLDRALSPEDPLWS